MDINSVNHKNHDTLSKIGTHTVAIFYLLDLSCPKNFYPPPLQGDVHIHCTKIVLTIFVCFYPLLSCTYLLCGLFEKKKLRQKSSQLTIMSRNVEIFLRFFNLLIDVNVVKEERVSRGSCDANVTENR